MFSVILISSFYLMSEQLELSLLRKNNRDNIQYYEENLLWTDSGLLVTDDERKLQNGYYVIATNMNHECIFGEYPPDFEGVVFSRKMGSVVELNGRKYVVTYKLHYGRRNSISYILYGIADTSAAATILDEIKRTMIGFMLFSLATLIAICLLLKHRIDRPLKKMCEEADKMEPGMNYDKEQMTESGFQEIDMLERAYLRLFDKMSNVIESQTRFNSDVSHELRTPITVIRTQCQVSREQALGSDDTHTLETIEVIERQADKMNRTINILLHLSKLGSGAAELNIEKFDLMTVAESVCDDEEFMPDRDRVIVRDLKETMVRADIQLVMIAVRNLFSNAIKYSEEGSVIFVQCGNKDGCPFFRIVDQGVGISEKEMEKIYDNFYRSEESRTSEGVGLGLPLTKKIMEIQGGRIEGSSTPGQGSSFTLWFPPVTEKET